MDRYHNIHRDVVLVNLDVVLQLICEAMLTKTQGVEDTLREIFIAGDTNKDGVLSYYEFLAIVHTAAPDFHDRKILKMYREALLQGGWVGWVM